MGAIDTMTPAELVSAVAAGALTGAQAEAEFRRRWPDAVPSAVPASHRPAQRVLSLFDVRRAAANDRDEDGGSP